jgi:hypothetical protein
MVKIMNIQAADLVKSLQWMLDNQVGGKKETFKILHDYYWWIVKEERYTPYNEPTNFTMGQLTMDWENLQETLEGKREATSLHLVWLGCILIAIGESNEIK